MSHFVIGIILPKNIFNDGENSITRYIESKMKKYNENIDVEQYIAYDVNKKDMYRENKINEYKKMMEIPDFEKIYNVEYLTNTLNLYLDMSSDEYWDNNIASYYDKNSIDENGNIMSKYNPDSKWDYYVIGGRWNGYFMDKDIKAKNIIGMNSNKIESYLEKYNNDPDKYKLFAYVNKDGDWTESARMLMFGMETNVNLEYDKILTQFLAEQNKDDYIVFLDCHI